MKLGRNLTNLFTIEMLSEKQKDLILSGKENMFAMNAWGGLKMKADINNLAAIARKLNIHHLELDCDVPSPYPEFSKEKRRQLKQIFRDNGLTLSVHLPYTMSAVSNIASPQAGESQNAVLMAKKYIDFAVDAGALYVNIHPGKAPFYFNSVHFLKTLEENMVNSLYALVKYTEDNSDIKFHLENNTAFDGFYYNIDDCLRVVKKIREQGAKSIYFNFDIGHWFTRESIKEKLPVDLLSPMKDIPSDMVWEFHLNDFITETTTFHPPLMEQKGHLTKDRLKEYAAIIKKLGVELLLLETAFHTTDDLKNRYDIIHKENAFIEEIFGVKW
ncbi:MAG: sugar phosphate isomerase/epimerase [Spirochaetes bacterium]|nr:sugar phosphate isomerase/epimerase [Spirochaetota bacterium]